MVLPLLTWFILPLLFITLGLTIATQIISKRLYKSLDQSYRTTFAKFTNTHPDIARWTRLMLWTDVAGVTLIFVGWFLDIILTMYFKSLSMAGEVILYLGTIVGILVVTLGIIIRRNVRRLYQAAPFTLPKSSAGRIFISSRILLVIIAILGIFWLPALLELLI